MTSDTPTLAPVGLITQVPQPFACANDHSDAISTVTMPEATPTPNCHLCGSPIIQRYYILLSPNLYAHEACLCCRVCWTPLHLEASCYLRAGYIYCAEHYQRMFLTCAACGRTPNEGEMVRRVSNYLFHMTCLRCSVCRTMIGTGERAIRDPEGNILCVSHAGANRERFSTSVSEPSSPSSSSSSPFNQMKSTCTSSTPVMKNSRSRTVLSEAQVLTLRSFYDQNPRPDSYIKEQLASLTGLTTRVIRVWFQNNRCKDKKRRQLSERLSRRKPLEESIRAVDLPSIGELHRNEELLLSSCSIHDHFLST